MSGNVFRCASRTAHIRPRPRQVLHSCTVPQCLLAGAGAWRLEIARRFLRFFPNKNLIREGVSKPTKIVAAATEMISATKPCLVRRIKRLNPTHEGELPELSCVEGGCM
jgi:hypothetical protein